MASGLPQSTLSAAQNFPDNSSPAQTNALGDNDDLPGDATAATLGVKEQVRAQFGADSNELQAIGLKKKSEKARPGTKQPATPTP